MNWFPVLCSFRPVPSLPSIPGLPENHSLRPYTVFELNQIRQIAHRSTHEQFVCGAKLALMLHRFRVTRRSHLLFFVFPFPVFLTDCFTKRWKIRPMDSLPVGWLSLSSALSNLRKRPLQRPYHNDALGLVASSEVVVENHDPLERSGQNAMGQVSAEEKQRVVRRGGDRRCSSCCPAFHICLSSFQLI